VAAALIAATLTACGDEKDGDTTAPAQPPGPDAVKSAARKAGCEVRDTASEGNRHVNERVRYRTNPPTSGDHFPVPAQDGVYTKAPPAEALVHSLEHGRIVIQYHPGLDPARRGDLKRVYDENTSHVILTPNQTGMRYEVALTAWTHLLGCPQLNERVPDAIRAFRDAYRDKGPEFVP
jgi:hypothetical protein